jgi:hypothetical protein
VRGPTPASYQAPTVDFSWLGNLMQDYREAQLAPLKLGLARNELARSGLELGALQRYMGGLGIGQPSPSTGPQTSAEPTVEPTRSAGATARDPRGMIPTLVEASNYYGHDPGTVIRAAQSEGLAQFYGDNRKSGTALQLYTGGGLGNEFQKETGLDPLNPENEKAALWWAVGNLGRTGWSPYKGAAKVGIGNWQGINRGAAPGATAKAGTGTSQPAPNEDLATAAQSGPPFAPTSNAAAAAPSAAGPSNIRLASGYDRGLTPDQARAAGLTPAQIATDRAATQPQPMRTAQAQQPQQPPEPEFDPQVLALRRRAQALISQAQQQGNLGAIARIPGAEQSAAKLVDQAKIYQGMADERVKRLDEERQRGLETSAQLTRTQQASEVKRYDEAYDAIQKKDDEASNVVQTLHLAQGFMNDPDFNSGATAKYDLQLKRVIAAVGGDPNAALPMEGFKKAVGSAILEQIRSLGGQGLGQVRTTEINTMKDAAQNPENTPAANRLLTEMGLRLAERWTQPIAELARDYAAKHGGHLDQGWDKVKAEFMNKTPLFSKEELADIRRIAPPLARDMNDLARIGWRDGMPFKTPDGRVLTHAPKGPAQPATQPARGGTAVAAPPPVYNPYVNPNAF